MARHCADLRVLVMYCWVHCSVRAAAQHRNYTSLLPGKIRCRNGSIMYKRCFRLRPEPGLQDVDSMLPFKVRLMAVGEIIDGPALAAEDDILSVFNESDHTQDRSRYGCTLHLKPEAEASVHGL